MGSEMCIRDRGDIKQAFDRESIEIPIPHRSVYFGDDCKPFDPRVLDKLFGLRDGDADPGRKAG